MDLAKEIQFVFYIVLIFGCLLLRIYKCDEDEEVADKCNVFINEINVNNPVKPESNEFIELFSLCDGFKASVSLRGYKVILISTGTTNNEEITIEFVATLWNSRSNENGFFTIGGPGVENADLRVPNDFVKFRNSFNKNREIATTNFLKNGNHNIAAIALIYGKGNALESIALTQSRPFIKVHKSMKTILKEHVKDIVVYARGAPFDKCGFFEELHPDFVDKKYVLREFDIYNKSDFSLNRCTLQTLGFLPESFKVGNPTPNAENDCSGTHFILEEHILNITSSVLRHENDYTRNDEAACSSSLQSNAYFSMSAEKVDEQLQRDLNISRSEECTSSWINPDEMEIQMDLDRANERKRKFDDDEDYAEDFDWETEKYFKYCSLLYYKFLLIYVCLCYSIS